MSTPWKDDSELVAAFERELTAQTNVVLNKLSDGSAFAWKFIEENDINMFSILNSFSRYALARNEAEARKLFMAEVAQYLMPYINNQARENTIKAIGYDIY